MVTARSILGVAIISAIPGVAEDVPCCGEEDVLDRVEGSAVMNVTMTLCIQIELIATYLV